MASTAPPKKRKRDASGLLSKPIAVATAADSAFPPIVATSRGVALPGDLAFQPYARTVHDKRTKLSRTDYLVHGAAPRIDYVGAADEGEAAGPRHYVGIFDPATQRVELHAAPRLFVARHIQAHAARDVDVAKRGAALDYAEARTALGKEFGTSKAKKALHSRELNRIDHSGMDKALSTAILDRVAENTRDMPTSAQLGELMTEERPVPRHNAATADPAEVYAREDVVPAEEWEALDVAAWLKAKAARAKSDFALRRANRLLEGDAAKTHVRTLKLCRYVDYLVGFFKVQAERRGRLPAMGAMQKILGMAPQVVVEGFYRKFAEQTREGAKETEDRYRVSPVLAQKTLYYLAICCLMVDHFDVDLFDLKTDLGLLPREIADAFKQVGCKIREPTAAQATSQKMTKAEASQHKRAVLTAPVEFPPPPRRRAQARR